MLDKHATLEFLGDGFFVDHFPLGRVGAGVFEHHARLEVCVVQGDPRDARAKLANNIPLGPPGERATIDVEKPVTARRAERTEDTDLVFSR